MSFNFTSYFTTFWCCWPRTYKIWVRIMIRKYWCKTFLYTSLLLCRSRQNSFYAHTEGYSKTFLLKQFSMKVLTKTIDIVLQSSSTGLALISTTWSVTLIRCTISYKVSRTHYFKNCCFAQKSIQLRVSMFPCYSSKSMKDISYVKMGSI